MKSNFKYFCFIIDRHLMGGFDSFPSDSIVVKSSRSFDELKDLFPFTHEKVKCVDDIPLSDIPLNKFCQLTFGDPHLTPDDVTATRVVHRKDIFGDVEPYLRIKVDDFTYLYFHIWDYDPKTRSGFIHARLTIPDDLKK